MTLNANKNRTHVDFYRVPCYNGYVHTVRGEVSKVPNTKSAIKRDRQSKVRRMRNKATRSAVKTSVRQFEEALHAGETAVAGEALRQSTRLLDKAAGKGVMHKKTAARKKSRLTRMLNVQE